MLKGRVRGRRDRKRFDRDWNGLIAEAFMALPRGRKAGVIAMCVLATAGLFIPTTTRSSRAWSSRSCC